MLTVAAGSATDPGVVRAVNEDSALTGARVFAVADGLGGQAAGDVAARVAITALKGLGGTAFGPAEVSAALTGANAEIVAAATGAAVGMGTTIAGLAIVVVGGTEHWLVFNVGDSRVYRYADTHLIQVTVDHSEVAELVLAGTLSPAQAREYPRRHVITRCLGTEPAPVPDLWVFPPVAGERFVLCSDGLPLELEDAAIAAILAAHADPQEAAEALVREALAAGGRDNVTAVVVDLVAADPGADANVATVPRGLAGTGPG
jgi:protein phosphatase